MSCESASSPCLHHAVLFLNYTAFTSNLPALLHALSLLSALHVHISGGLCALFGAGRPIARPYQWISDHISPGCSGLTDSWLLPADAGSGRFELKRTALLVAAHQTTEPSLTHAAFHSHPAVLYWLLNIPFHLYPLCSLLFDQASTIFLWGGCDAVNFIDGPHGVDAHLHLLHRCDGVGAAANFIGVESSTRGAAALAAPQTLFVPAEPWERMHVCITFYCSATLSSVGRWILWHGTIRGA